MGHKDIISKQVFKRILIDVATYVFALELDKVELIETEQQRVEDRRADLTAKVKDKQGQRFILHIEIQNQNRGDMPDRMLRYLTDIRLNHPGEEVFQYLLYIGEERLTIPEGIESRQLNYRYGLVDMHAIDYKLFMAQDTPDAIVMAILCDFKGESASRVVHDLLGKLMQLTRHDARSLREYISMLEILASNRNIDIDIQQEFAMLQVEIEKLPSFVMGEKKGLKMGLEKGIERGMEKGIEKGIETGEKRKALLVAKRLLALQMPIEQIAQITELETAEIEKLLS